MKKRKVRRKVFETNSSSSHSISIDDTDFLLDTLIPNEEGIIIITPGEFGWEWEAYNTADIKASYCLTAIQYLENKELARTNLKEVIQTQTLCKEVILATCADEMHPNGYIDHQSRTILDETFFANNDLFNFIFNKKSWLLLGNDNQDYCWDIDNLNKGIDGLIEL